MPSPIVARATWLQAAMRGTISQNELRCEHYDALHEMGGSLLTIPLEHRAYFRWTVPDSQGNELMRFTKLRLVATDAVQSEDQAWELVLTECRTHLIPIEPISRAREDTIEDMMREYQTAMAQPNVLGFDWARAAEATPFQGLTVEAQIVDEVGHLRQEAFRDLVEGSFATPEPDAAYRLAATHSVAPLWELSAQDIEDLEETGVRWTILRFPSDSTMCAVWCFKTDGELIRYDVTPVSTIPDSGVWETMLQQGDALMRRQRRNVEDRQTPDLTLLKTAAHFALLMLGVKVEVTTALSGRLNVGVVWSDGSRSDRARLTEANVTPRFRSPVIRQLYERMRRDGGSQAVAEMNVTDPMRARTITVWTIGRGREPLTESMPGRASSRTYQTEATINWDTPPSLAEQLAQPPRARRRRTPRIPTTVDEIYAAMPQVARQAARELFGELSEEELEDLGIECEDSDDLSTENIVALANEIARREQILDASDDVLADNADDYREVTEDAE